MTQPREAPAGYNESDARFSMVWDGRDTATTGWLIRERTPGKEELLAEVPYRDYATRLIDALRLQTYLEDSPRGEEKT